MSTGPRFDPPFLLTSGPGLRSLAFLVTGARGQGRGMSHLRTGGRGSGREREHPSHPRQEIIWSEHPEPETSLVGQRDLQEVGAVRHQILCASGFGRSEKSIIEYIPTDRQVSRRTHAE